MEHTIWSAAAVLGLGVMLAGTGAGAAPKSGGTDGVRRELQGQCDRYAQAIRKKDADAAMGITADDFSLKTRGHTLDREKAQQALKSRLGQFNLSTRSRISARVSRVKLTGDGAEATTSVSIPLVLKDRRGRKSTGTQVTTSREVWTKTDEGWRVKRSEVLSDSLRRPRPRPRRPRPAEPVVKIRTVK